MDAEQTTSSNLIRFLAWLEVNKKRVILWGAVAAAVIAVVAAVLAYESQKEIRASEALANVRVPFTASLPVPPNTADAYLKVAREYGGTKAASRALLLAATTKFTDANYAEAQKLFEQFTRDYPDSPWLPQAMYGVASCLDAQQKNTEAVAKYEELRRRFPNDALSDETKLALGRLFEVQNKPVDAFKLYDEVLKSNPYGYSGIGAEAGARMEDLVGKYPGLKTNLPSATPPTPTITATNRPSTNRVVTLTNLMNRPATNAPKAPATATPATTPAPAPTANQPATSAPLLIKPGAASTNQP